MINKSITAITVAAVVISMYFSYIIIVHFANNNNNVIGIISIGAAIPSINTCTNRIKLCQRPMKARQCNAATKQHKIRLSAFRKHEQSSQGCCQRLMLFIRWSNDISYFYFLYIFFFSCYIHRKCKNRLLFSEWFHWILKSKYHFATHICWQRRRQSVPPACALINVFTFGCVREHKCIRRCSLHHQIFAEYCIRAERILVDR